MPQFHRTGATDRGVAHAMKCSQATAQEFLEKARKKLRASTRALAVATAVALGIMSA